MLSADRWLQGRPQAGRMEAEILLYFLCVSFSHWCLVTGKNIKCEKGRLLKSCQPQLNGKFPHTHSSRGCANAVKILVCHKA